MIKRILISHSGLLAMVSYEPTTGEFRWIEPLLFSPVKRGDLAGSKNGAGYCSIRINRRAYLAHRLAWFYVTGAWPVGEIDHKNGDRFDNRFENLRLSTHSQNMGNRKINTSNATGFKGIWIKDGKFAAEIAARGERRWLGCFDTPEEAHAAYAAAAIEIFGEFARVA